ncbi:MAG: hypothetical protein DLM73_02110 [Chthoniobacterales bacterium]|nr:MAG: hypothetical protein DLM73_02110 [Chthoniobacterales bacterium]
MKYHRLFNLPILLACICAIVSRSAAQTGSIPVPGSANPWLADAATAAGGDAAPGQSPVLVQLVDFNVGDEITFSATGSVQYGGGTPTDPPDGDSGTFRSLFHLFDSTNGGPENGIAGLNAPANSLVGVFLRSSAPVPGGSPAPFFNFAPGGNVPGNIDYTSLQPTIAQPFFIGDGRTASGIPQRVNVPAGATRLFLGTMDGSGWFNNSGSFSVTITLASHPPVAPAHGGLSATVFTVNGSSSPSANVADTALRFAAQQTGTPAGLIVRVQVNTVPNNNANDWVDLNNGSKGYMTLDKGTQQFVLSSTNYGLANGLYFRALSTADGYPPSASNIVGPLDLTAGQSHLGTTTLYVATNGPGQEMKFRAQVGTDQAGIGLSIQATTSPHDEASWTDLNDGNSGGMHPFADAKQFYLDTTKYPAGDAVYFRAVATAPGFLKSLSNIIGVSPVVVGAAPEVNAFPSTLDQLQPGSGSGLTPNDPFILLLGSLKFTAQASSREGRAINKLGLIYDGSTLGGDRSGDKATLDYQTNVPGDHTLKAFATDDRGITGYAEPVYIRIAPPGGKVFTMSSFGNWNDANNWRDALGNNGVPGANDFAIVGASNVSITQSVNAYAVSLIGGSINGAGGGLTVTGSFQIAGGQLKNLNTTITDSGTLSLVGDGNVPMSGSLINYGTFKLTGRGGIVPVPVGAEAVRSAGAPGIDSTGIFDGFLTAIQNFGNWIIHRPSTPPKPKPIPPTPPPVELPRLIVASTFENKGKLITNDGGSLITNDGGSLITNDGGSIIGNDGASLISQDGGSIVASGGGNIVASGAGNLIGNDGASIVAQGGGNFTIRSGDGVNAATAGSGFVQTGGETDLSHMLISGAVSIEGGTLTGSGIIVGNVTNNSFISPGHSAGAISILGNYTQRTQGTLIVENGGAGPRQYDRLQVSGTASLGGKLDVRDINGYTPDPADTFSPLGFSSATGSLTTSSNGQITLTANGALASVDPTKPAPSTGQPLNIATRLAIQSGDNVLIAGFIVTGPSGSTKKVLIRGLGPSLAGLGVPGTISDPLLELHKPDGSVVINDDWQQGDTSQIPSGFAPSDPRESVVVATLGPGNYTAILKGAHGETGVGLAEVYDLDSASAAQLGNIATRGLVQTGDNVLIGGFIIGGTEPAKVVVRAIAPSLAAILPGVLQATTLELHDSNGSVISNEGWRSTQESELLATQLQPANDNEAAILATLVPGNYTAIVRGKNNTTGIAVVEAYNLQ